MPSSYEKQISWHSVDDFLPEDKDYCLVIMADGSILKSVLQFDKKYGAFYECDPGLENPGAYWPKDYEKKQIQRDCNLIILWTRFYELYDKE